MRYFDLFEGRNIPCVVVDVQPQYIDYSGVDWVPELMMFLNNQRNNILMFVNAEEQGMTPDTIGEIQFFWEDNGFESQNWNRVEVNDKGYGYFRNWMDNGVEDKIIVKTIREMYNQKISSVSDLFDGDTEEQINFLSKLGMDDYGDVNDAINEEIHVEWTSVAQLKRYNNCYIMGGGRNECLKEVQLLMNAFNIKYKVIEKFVYG